jgi:hypothetical protein
MALEPTRQKAYHSQAKRARERTCKRQRERLKKAILIKAPRGPVGR